VVYRQLTARRKNDWNEIVYCFKAMAGVNGARFTYNKVPLMEPASDLNPFQVEIRNGET